jgi:hypothetical protein
LDRLGRPTILIRDNFVIDLHYEVTKLRDRTTQYTSRVLISGRTFVIFNWRFTYQGLAPRSSSFEVNLDCAVSTTRGHFSLSQLGCLRKISGTCPAVSNIYLGYLVIRWARYVRHDPVLSPTRHIVRSLVRWRSHLRALEARSIAFCAWVFHRIIFLF